jgi:hypothetical protein
MTRLTRLGLWSLVVLAVAGFASSTAIAEDSTPLILVLSGEKISGLKGKGEAKEEALVETEAGKTIKCKTSTGELTATFGGSETDINLASGTLASIGCKQGAVACRSETKAGVKDPIETVLASWDVHVGDEKSTENVLEPVLFIRLGKENLLINCGGVKEEIRGGFLCLILPGLTNIPANVSTTILCKESKGKETTGTCENEKAFCEEVAKSPLEANLGAGFEKAGFLIHFVFFWNLMIFIDD